MRDTGLAAVLFVCTGAGITPAVSIAERWDSFGLVLCAKKSMTPPINKPRPQHDHDRGGF